MGNQLVKTQWPISNKIPDFGATLSYISDNYGALDSNDFLSYANPIGIEVEVEGVKKEIPHMLLWQHTEDGSLKDNGREFVSYILSGILIDYALFELFDIFSMQGKLSWSHRTSIHIHINLSNLPTVKLKWLIAYYALTEPLWYRECDELRIGNSFCFPICSMSPHDLEPGKSWPKYCGLNLGSSICKFNTAEFRHMHGHQNKELLVKWIKKIYKFVDYIKTTPVKKLNYDIRNYLLFGDMDFTPFMGDVPENIYSVIYDNAKWVADYLGAN